MKKKSVNISILIVTSMFIINCIGIPNTTSDEIKSGSCDDSVPSILQFINDENEHMNFNAGSAILVLGLTGSGKTTLSLLLTNANLNSVEASENSGIYRIVDENDLISGNSTIESKTLIPNLMIDKMEDKVYTFYDCPGFSDTRSVKHDMLAMYSIFRLLKSVDAAKFLISISYTAVTSFIGDRSDFNELTEHVIHLLKDVGKYRDAISFVVTKVPNQYRMIKRVPRLIEDNQVIQSIVNFLTETKAVMQNKNEKANIPDEMRRLNNQKIKFIEILLEKNTNNEYSKIGILRLADSDGSVQELELMQDEKKNINNIVYNRTSYISITNNDFGITISHRSQNCMHGLMNEMRRHLLLDISQIDDQIQEFFQKFEEQNSDLELLKEKMSLGYRTLERIAFKNHEFSKTLKQIIDAAETFNFDIGSSLTNFKKHQEIIAFFETVSNVKSSDVYDIDARLDKSIQYLSDSKDWYKFLTRLHDTLSQYEWDNEATKSNLDEVMAIVSNSENIGMIFGDIGLMEFMARIDNETYQGVSDVTVNSCKLKALETVLQRTLIDDIEQSCSSDKLTVKGYNVRLKDVMSIECSEKIIFFEIFALNKIFIDENINKTGETVRLSIIAPTWEVIDHKLIILNGGMGKSHSEKRAKDGRSSFLNGHGHHGASGLPGGSAGHFFGIGNTFVNIESLEIHANGGQGGVGQDGGNGVASVQGRDPTSSDCGYGYTGSSLEYLKKQWTDEGFRYVLINFKRGGIFSADLYEFMIYGTNGEKGGDGGNGGVGGFGGNAGTIMLIGLNEVSKYIELNRSGEIGQGGKGGAGGEEAKHGYARDCKLQHDDKIVVLSDVLYNFGNTHIPAGKNGSDGVNNMNTTLPETVQFQSPLSIISDYKMYVKERLHGSNYNINLNFKKFQADLDENEASFSLYDSQALIDEFQNIEYQCMGLRNEFSFIPNFKPLQNRIEKYSKSDDIKLENKKVLSFLYTATLSKLCAIKNKVYHNPVIDLDEYIDEMMTNIKIMLDNGKHFDIANYRIQYETDADEKIQFAIDFIKHKIEPEINTILEHVEHQFHTLYKGAVSRQQSSEYENKELEKMFLWKKMLIPLKVASFGISFLGPAGAAAGVVIGISTSTVESLSLDNSTKRNDITLPRLDSETVKVVNDLKQIYDNKHEIFISQLDAMQQEVDQQFDENQDDSDWKSIKEEIHNEIQSLNAEQIWKDKSAKGVINALRECNKKRKNLITSFGSRAMSWTEKPKNFLRKWETVLKTYEFYEYIQGEIETNDKQNKVANDMINTLQSELDLLEKYEESIYDGILKMVEHAEKDLVEKIANFDGYSHDELDVSKWGVKSSLQDIKDIFRIIASDFKIDGRMKNLIDELESAIDVVIDVYDRIDLYSDNRKFGDYIANIGSAGSMGISIENNALATNLAKLEQTIRTNVLLEQFDLVRTEVRLHKFPFGQFILPESESLFQRNDTESLFNDTFHEIQNLKEQIKLSTMNYDNEIFENIIFSSSHMSDKPPFYTWQNNEIRNEIIDLLRGKEIKIKADVTKGLDLNAIKFNEIGINLKMQVAESQSRLDAALQHFDVRMEMIGHNYYRCDDKFFSMPIKENITIEYSMERGQDGNPLRKNVIFDKIRKSSVLSPYTMWHIKLLKVKSYYHFIRLKKFENEIIDLELQGRGSFTKASSPSAGICDSPYYKHLEILTLRGTHESSQAFFIFN